MIRYQSAREDRPVKKLWKSKAPEWTVFGLFAVFFILISVFHEPWFDEAQAWQIARCASLKEILLTIPHYEGHPPLWHLILAIPARLGVPFEWGLKTVGVLIAFAAAGLLIFRSGLPRAFRLCLPFSFFIFYQYGVIVRPYGLMLLLLLLLGQNMAGRAAHPWRFMALLAFLCLTSAYGIVIAGGISVCILWDLLKEKGMKRFWAESLSDPRSGSLLVLLVIALLLIAEIMPRSDTWVTSATGKTPLWICVLCALFTFLGDCLITDSSWFHTDTHLLQKSVIPPGELAAYSILGILILTLILSVSSKKNSL